MGHHVGVRILDVLVLRERGFKRETKLLNMLLFIKSNLWKVCVISEYIWYEMWEFTYVTSHLKQFITSTKQSNFYVMKFLAFTLLTLLKSSLKRVSLITNRFL